MKLLVDNWSTFLMFLVFWFGYNEMKAPQYSRGEIAPNFTAITIDGYDLDLEEYKGKYVLLDFWASWCAPCRRDNPQLVEIYHQYKDRKFKDAEGFVILSVSIDRKAKSWLKAIEDDKLAWRTHILETDDNQGISDLYSVEQVPTKYLISPDGKIIGTNWTFNKLRRFLKKRKV